MKVQLKIYPSGAIECMDHVCRNATNCANHWSASDSRMEIGFTPGWGKKVFFLGGGEAICFSKENNAYNYTCGALAMDVEDNSIFNPFEAMECPPLR